VIQVAVLSNDTQLAEALRSAGLKVGRITVDALTVPSQSASAPAALVVDVRGERQLPPGIAAFSKQHPGTGIVLVAASLDPHLMLEAMRAGVTECLQDPVTPQMLDQAVRRVLVDTVPEQLGRVIAFVGAKGGVGTTTLAVNTTTTLARAGVGDVLLVDLNTRSGDAALFLGAEPRFTVVDVLENVHRLDDAFFRGIVEKTKVGADFLGSSDRVSQSAADPQRIRALLDFALRKYRVTVLDVSSSDMAALDALEIASSIVVVTSQELPSVRSAARLTQALRTRYGGTPVKAVINRFDKSAEIAKEDVERVIGGSVHHTILSNYREAVEALNIGKPIVLRTTGPLAQSLRRMASDLGGVPKPAAAEQRSAGVLGRLAFRRA
jgi:pilus assembly protein CpaE